MARKTNGNGTTNRRKNAAASVQPYALQVVPDDRKNARTIDLDEEIRCRAFEIYLERGGTGGDEYQDWLLAEREIRARHQQEYSA
ncbi:MAG TPA: DUF2934 domain-containing protein [Terriglobales bacterium]|nr:DUF2934 domain-containing protein [Terriglobales bacterium]